MSCADKGSFISFFEILMPFISFLMSYCTFSHYHVDDHYHFYSPFCEIYVKIFFIVFVLQLTKAHRQGHMVKVDWLDRLTFREIEMINEVGCIPRFLHFVFLQNIFSILLTQTLFFFNFILL